MIVDTSGLLAALFADQSHHAECAQALSTARPPLLLSPFVLAEVDYLVTREAGVAAELDLLVDVGRGSYELIPFGTDDVDEAKDVIESHRDLNIGLADASIVVMSRRFTELALLSLDERHFR